MTGPADDARALAEQLPSTTSRDHGRPFAEVFKAYKGDFYRSTRCSSAPRGRSSPPSIREKPSAPARSTTHCSMPLSLESVAIANASGRPKVAIAVDLYDWHARDLMAAFSRAGVVAAPIRLAQCGFRHQAPERLIIPGFGADCPDAVFVRAIGSGSFEASPCG